MSGGRLLTLPLVGDDPGDDGRCGVECRAVRCCTVYNGGVAQCSAVQCSAVLVALAVQHADCEGFRW